MLKDLFLRLLSEESVTPNAANCLKIAQEFLSDFNVQYFNKNDVSNLLLSKEVNSSGVHLAFCGHIDVVPAGNGWEYDAFKPTIKDDLIIARGTQDMKSGVAAFLCAIKECKDFSKDIRKISVILTSDEEGDAIYGTKYVLENIKDMPDIAIVAEPTSENVFADTIKVGRRGSIHAYIKIKGTQGHAAYPSKCINPVHLGASFLEKIAAYDLDKGNEFFEPSKIVVLNLSAGIGAQNVTPSEFNIHCNVRNSTLSTKQDFENYLLKHLKGLDYELKITQGSIPFFTDTNNSLIKNLVKSVEKVANIKAALNTKGGTSDARFLAQYGVKVCELGVINNKIHAANESVNFKEVLELKNIFLDFLRSYKND
ncbi:succinyl-diaminopimelate desuccinylase [Campylobacter canadensis]|uniref:succinyl-diaminopimelate desuccinylase n=1 Tax=Campylobacter canadensis TaxID=449520 RepID=UPI001554D44A|nr:succinyl-diaminopimelate desuccinylase [Campylobacter canadensis]MBZ7995448.1 succinyl-diaminopimelate desuccinylase [Campylobacter canadensis]MBZ7997246.1 succinyl-diaminopimelate desuccinylase [Campylobacter canadensis]MBZ8000789.1 succinyl-diaminopimelate desuccinylase [Campylobacter canadensis]MBZ8002556.1 succinyl-diaminopimelate desuccinylase [Campylobacter canadensis]MBZ8004011.1 succinyl-diaminopimelate desuccinylase [Campylobacter canadensis]